MKGRLATLALGWLLSACPAHAVPDEDTDRARTLFFEALASIEDEDWASAERDLRRSQEIAPRASTLYNLALVTFRQGRHLESLELANALLQSELAGTDARYHEYARALAERVTRDVPHVELNVSPAQARVSVNGAEAAGSGSARELLVDPGPAKLAVDAAGYHAQQVELVLTAGERRSVAVTLQPRAVAPTEPPRSRERRAANASPEKATPGASAPNVAPWVLAGSGGALLIASAIAGFVARSQDDEFVDRCPELHDCDADLEPLQRRVETLGLITDVLLVTGGLAVLGGVGWWIAVPSVEVTPSPAGRVGGVALRAGCAF